MAVGVQVAVRELLRAAQGLRVKVLRAVRELQMLQLTVIPEAAAVLAQSALTEVLVEQLVQTAVVAYLIR